MIELDIVSFDLFELQPLTEYELYIKSFGMEDTRQVSWACLGMHVCATLSEPMCISYSILVDMFTPERHTLYMYTCTSKLPVNDYSAHVTDVHVHLYGDICIRGLS